MSLTVAPARRRHVVARRSWIARQGLCLLMVTMALVAAPAAKAGTWIGYMNVFNNNGGSQGGFVFGSPWGVGDLQTTVNVSNPGTIIGDNLTLQPNFNTYSDALAGSDADRAFWTDSTDGGVTAGPNGNKWMEANTIFEINPITDLTYTLAGTVDSNTLDNAYLAEGFVKVLDTNDNFNTVLNDRVTLPASGAFSIVSDLSAFQTPGFLMQVGFTVSGLNANPANAIALGSTTVTVTQPVPEPSTIGLCDVGAGLAGLVRLRKRKVAA